MRSRDIHERAVEAWIDNFISDHGREPTEEEIEAAEHDAYCDYLSGMIDEAYDRMKDDELGL